MKNKKSIYFTFIEMMVVVAVVLLLIGMTMKIFKDAGDKAKMVATVQNIETLSTAVGSYKLDFGVFPNASTVNSSTYTDASATANYWNRIDSKFKQVNTISPTTTNAFIRFDVDYDLNSRIVQTNYEFKTNYPTTDFSVPLDSWNVSDENLEKISVITHSSRFLNYYLSGTYLNIAKKLKYFEGKDFLMGNEDTAFRYYKDDGVLFNPHLYFKSNEEKLFSITGGKITEPPSLVSQLPGKNITYTEYVYKSAKNLNEDNLRRLYIMNDSPETVPVTGAPKVTLSNDVVVYQSSFFSQGDKNFNSPNSAKLHMRANTSNVKIIVDHFNSPLVYITYSNQLKSSARTYKDPMNDLSIDNSKFVIYSLGRNKRDDSNLAENNFQGTDKLGDDIISSHGKSKAK